MNYYSVIDNVIKLTDNLQRRMFLEHDDDDSEFPYVFTAQRYAWERSLVSPAVRPSVRLSVYLSRWCIVSRRLKISSNFFRSPVALWPWLQFFTPSADTQFQENPFSRGVKYTRWENFAIFDRNRRLSCKRYEIGSWLLWNVNRKS